MAVSKLINEQLEKDLERHGEGEISGVQFHRSDSGFPSSRAEQMALAHWPVEHSQTPIQCVDQI